MNTMIRKIICTLAATCFIIAVTAQPYDPIAVNKKAMAVYNQAMEKAQDGKFPEAITLINQSLSIEPKYLDAYLSLGGIYGQLKSYKASTDNYEKAFAIDSNYTSEYRLPYSINLAGQGRFEDALRTINAMLSREKMNPNTRKAGEYRKKTYEFAIDYAKKYPANNYVFAPHNLGDGINSAESEYFPSMTIDGKQMIFTRRLRAASEDFFSSTRKDTGWSLATPLPGKINTPQNEGAQMISQDGQWLVFAGTNRADSWGGFDIYISYLTPTGWSDPVNMGSHINTESWESQPCLSPDKRDLYFASRKPGGLGGSDIYVSHLVNGKWSEAENLGPQVNTAGDEQCPFMHADNQTLYFTSNTWPGYGDDDLFYTRKGPGGAWSNPVNLGYPINTINREGTLFIASDGKTAYYASDRSDSRGGLDIYSFELRKDLQPRKTLWVKGKVSDKKTLKGLPSNVELVDLAGNELVSRIQTDEQGNYLITLPVGKDYAFNISRPGYLFYSDQFMLAGKSPDSTYEKNISLQPIEVNASIILHNIFFDVKKFDLRPESQSELDKVVQLLNDNPAVFIEISGYTDNVGKPSDNLALSINRAKSVTAYLVRKGIAAARLTAKGYGETHPVANNNNEEGRGENRRTELKVIKR